MELGKGRQVYRLAGRQRGRKIERGRGDAKGDRTKEWGIDRHGEGERAGQGQRHETEVGGRGHRVLDRQSIGILVPYWSETGAR